MATKKKATRRLYGAGCPVDGARMFQARQAKGWRQMDLALKANVAQRYISTLEAGQGPDLRLSTFVRLADALEVDCGWLLNRSTQRARTV